MTGRLQSKSTSLFLSKGFHHLFVYVSIRFSLSFEWQISNPINHSSSQPYLRHTHRLIIKYTCGPKSLRWRKSLCSSNTASGLHQTFAQSAQEYCRRMDLCSLFKIWFLLNYVTLVLLCIVKAWRGTVILPEHTEKFFCAVRNMPHRSH